MAKKAKRKYTKMTTEGYAEWRKANRPKTYKDRKKDQSKNICRSSKTPKGVF